MPPFRGDWPDAKKQAWFETAIKHKFINSEKYGTLDQINAVLKWLRGSGLKDAQIRQLLGFQTDNPVIRKGEISPRDIRESIPPAVRADMDAVLGAETARSLEKYLRSKWAKARKLLTAEDVRDRTKSDLGHFIEGMLKDPDLAGPENSWLNRLRGAMGDSPERWTTPALEDVTQTDPSRAAWDAAAQQKTGNMPTPWGRQQVPTKDATQSSDLTFPKDVAGLVDNEFITAEQAAPLARELQNYDPDHRRAIIENIKVTGEVDFNVNPLDYKSTTAEPLSGPVKQYNRTDFSSSLVERYGKENITYHDLPAGGRVAKTPDGVFVIQDQGFRQFKRFKPNLRNLNPIGPMDVLESIGNERSGYLAGQGDWGGAAAAAGENFAQGLVDFFDPRQVLQNLTVSSGLGYLARRNPWVGAGLTAYSLGTGAVRFGEGYNAAQEGKSWEELQEERYIKYLEEQEKQQETEQRIDRQLGANKVDI